MQTIQDRYSKRRLYNPKEFDETSKRAWDFFVHNSGHIEISHEGN